MTLEDLKGKIIVIKLTVQEWIDEGAIVPEEGQVIAIMLIEEIIKKESIQVSA